MIKAIFETRREGKYGPDSNRLSVIVVDFVRCDNGMVATFKKKKKVCYQIFMGKLTCCLRNR